MTTDPHQLTRERPAAAEFLPTTRQEMDSLGWDAPDVVFVSGDAYVDHPSFAAAILGRWLQHHGFRVVILAQPDWRSAEAWRELRTPHAALLRGERRRHGLDDQPLHRQQEAAERGRLLAGRPDRPAARIAPPPSTPSAAARPSRACRS